LSIEQYPSALTSQSLLDSAIHPNRLRTNARLLYPDWRESVGVTHTLLKKGMKVRRKGK
jgi:hypothetical protein